MGKKSSANAQELLVELLKQFASADGTAVVDIEKVDAPDQNVFGWASVSITKDGEQVSDHQEDLIDPDDLESAAYEFNLDFRETGEMHRGVSKGRLIESMVFTPEKLEKLGLPPDSVDTAWWVGFHIDDPDAFQKVLKGEYKMFSIQGSAIREPVGKALSQPGGPEWEAHDANLAGNALTILDSLVQAVTTSQDREKAEPADDTRDEDIADLQDILDTLSDVKDAITDFQTGEKAEASSEPAVNKLRLDAIDKRIQALRKAAPHKFVPQKGHPEDCLLCSGAKDGDMHK